MWRSPLQAIRWRLSWIEERSLTKTESGNTRKNRKWIKERDFRSLKEWKIHFWHQCSTPLSQCIFCCQWRKEYLAFYLAGNCSSVWPVLISSPLIWPCKRHLLRFIWRAYCLWSLKLVCLRPHPSPAAFTRNCRVHGFNTFWL